MRQRPAVLRNKLLQHDRPGHVFVYLLRDGVDWAPTASRRPSTLDAMSWAYFFYEWRICTLLCGWLSTLFMALRCHRRGVWRSCDHRNPDLYWLNPPATRRFGLWLQPFASISDLRPGDAIVCRALNWRRRKRS